MNMGNAARDDASVAKGDNNQRILKAIGYDKDEREVVHFFDRGVIRTLVEPLPYPLYIRME